MNHGREFPGKTRVDAVVAEMSKRSVNAANFVSEEVSNKPYIMGDEFTAADIALGYTVMLFDLLVPNSMPAPLDAYWQRLAGRNGFQKAMRIGMP